MLRTSVFMTPLNHNAGCDRLSIIEQHAAGHPLADAASQIADPPPAKGCRPALLAMSVSAIGSGKRSIRLVAHTDYAEHDSEPTLKNGNSLGGWIWRATKQSRWARGNRRVPPKEKRGRAGKGSRLV